MDNSTYGLPAWQLAALSGTHIDTARRWKRAGQIPRQAAALISIRLHGELGTIDPEFEGFIIRRGSIWTPENAEIRPGELRAIPYRSQQIRELD
ncbi:hypothetical protein ACG33_07840 [Steroidobacter denitrificans]|uniref:Uncharacterized protein n=1 Tax=Steroidobacter denitrificans TaxID=465721 RepID=A0A127FBN4_STEDE|nr:hypothetical protein [Steroidobacter denitrificans]AMN47008.1 hypothetical protein ACG33_07840 [Steroidobacter denitrificans]